MRGFIVYAFLLVLVLSGIDNLLVISFHVSIKRKLQISCISAWNPQ